MSEDIFLEIKDLHVSVEGKKIIKGLNLKVQRGETHAMMGPNGSGKSTLALTIMGHPKYEVTQGSLTYKGKDLLELSTDERANLGLYLGFQHPHAISGLNTLSFLLAAIKGRTGKAPSAPKMIKETRRVLKELDMSSGFINRYVNEGFSGGERKKNEILQMLLLKPEIAILDEPDSGLDIDALKVVAYGVNKLREEEGVGVLIITHYQRILEWIKPDYVHVFVDGRIVKSGGPELALQLEDKGYEPYVEKFAVA
ncbi:MAG: Fe-S cluster assembly ATPase SufC [Candidatus Thorarchaeota archaeon]